MDMNVDSLVALIQTHTKSLLHVEITQLGPPMKPKSDDMDGFTLDLAPCTELTHLKHASNIFSLSYPMNLSTKLVVVDIDWRFCRPSDAVDFIRQRRQLEYFKVHCEILPGDSDKWLQVGRDGGVEFLLVNYKPYEPIEHVACPNVE